MFQVRVESHFAAAHFLSDYHGKCENLHGHNYKVRAHVCGESLDSGGMLLDFGILKAALNDVCALLDHTNLNDRSEFHNNPSAERIAQWIFMQVSARLPHSSGETAPARLTAVDVFETETSRARYSE